MRLLKLFTRLHTNVLRDLFHSTDDDYTCIYYNTFNSQNNCCQTNFSSGKLSIVGKIPYKSKTKCRASFFLFFFRSKKNHLRNIYIFSTIFHEHDHFRLWFLWTTNFFVRQNVFIDRIKAASKSL